MRVCAIQPAYSMEYEKADECFEGLLSLLDRCDDQMDLIVLPEYCDVPVATSGKAQFEACVEKYNARILEKAKETAVRCRALVFVNAAYRAKKGLRNTTWAIDASGRVAGQYFKAHPAPSEWKSADQGGSGLDTAYADERNEVYTIDVDGMRYGFMTCYDFYFYEAFSALARKNVDIIIGASHQRTDTFQALDVSGRFLSYNTNAYLVRASVSLGASSKVGGCTMVVAPDGTMLKNLQNEVGLAVCDIDPRQKYEKPAGFRGARKAHWEYVEEGRRPRSYRQSGSAIVLPDARMPYPRVCAHRGFNAVAPENTMPAFGAAVALGAEEIEFDLWTTTDGVLVSCHDPVVDHVSNGKGRIYEHAYPELLKYDFGVKKGEAFEGLKICTFEEILQKFACQTIFNIHVKEPDMPGNDDEALLEKVVALIRAYDCEKHCYFMSASDDFLRLAREKAPDIARCAGENDQHFEIVNRAIRLGCQKVQLFAPYFNQEMIDLAHAHGIICNVFYADTPELTEKYLNMGCDTVLTNNYQRVACAVRRWKAREAE